jgi:hypothetical protein
VENLALEELCGLIQKELIKPERLIRSMAQALDNKTLTPNSNHYLLARALHKGYLIVTTNYDSQIERAYRVLYKRRFPPKNIAYDESSFGKFVRQFQMNKLQTPGWLLKLHGSFYIDRTFYIGRAFTKDSVITMLQRVGKGLSLNSDAALRRALTTCPTVVLGYGAIDLDIVYPVMINTQSDQPLWWVMHENAKKVVQAPNLQVDLQCEELKLARGEPVDTTFLNVIRILINRSKSTKDVWLISYLTSQFVKAIASQLGYAGQKEPQCECRTPQSWTPPWLEILHKFGTELSDAECFLTIGNIAQISAIRRLPNTPSQATLILCMSSRIMPSIRLAATPAIRLYRAFINPSNL